MKISLIFGFCVLLATGTNSCKDQSNSTSAENTATEAPATPDNKPFQDADVTAFKQLIAQYPDAIILDVRTPEEFQEGHIQGAILLDVMEDSFGAEIQELDKNKKYLVYCRSGGRSVTACNEMAEAGFGDLTNLLGGFTAWSQEE